MRLFYKIDSVSADVLEINRYAIYKYAPDISERFVADFKGRYSRATPSVFVYPLFARGKRIEVEFTRSER